MFDKIVNEMLYVHVHFIQYFCHNLPSDAGNNIAQDCQLLFGLVAKEMWFKLLAHVCNFSCYRPLFDPYNLCKNSYTLV